jgi:hypothetical protein
MNKFKARKAQIAQFRTNGQFVELLLAYRELLIAKCRDIPFIPLAEKEKNLLRTSPSVSRSNPVSRPGPRLEEYRNLNRSEEFRSSNRRDDYHFNRPDDYMHTSRQEDKLLYLPALDIGNERALDYSKSTGSLHNASSNKGSLAYPTPHNYTDPYAYDTGLPGPEVAAKQSGMETSRNTHGPHAKSAPTSVIHTSPFKVTHQPTSYSTPGSATQTHYAMYSSPNKTQRGSAGSILSVSYNATSNTTSPPYGLATYVPLQGSTHTGPYQPYDSRRGSNGRIHSRSHSRSQSVVASVATSMELPFRSRANSSIEGSFAEGRGSGYVDGQQGYAISRPGSRSSFLSNNGEGLNRADGEAVHRRAESETYIRAEGEAYSRKESYVDSGIRRSRSPSFGHALDVAAPRSRKTSFANVLPSFRNGDTAVPVNDQTIATALNEDYSVADKAGSNEDYSIRSIREDPDLSQNVVQGGSIPDIYAYRTYTYYSIPSTTRNSVAYSYQASAAESRRGSSNYVLSRQSSGLHGPHGDSSSKVLRKLHLLEEMSPQLEAFSVTVEETDVPKSATVKSAAVMGEFKATELIGTPQRLTSSVSIRNLID